MENTKEAYAEYVMDGVDFLTNLQIANLEKKIEVIISEPLTPLEQAIISANEKNKFVSQISGSFRKFVEQCVVGNIVVVYEANPKIHMDDAIKIAFTHGLISDFFAVEDLEKAVRKTLPKRGW